MRLTHLSSFLLAMSLLLAAIGCQPPAAEVTGTVTADGKTVTAGSIILQPLAEGVKPAAGVIDASGTFEPLTAGGGKVVPGEYRLVYSAPAAIEGEGGEVAREAKLWRGWRAPQETVSINEGPNTLTVELVRP